MTSLLDDDGRPKRTGTFWTTSAHIMTAVIGSGVLSLSWAIAQLGWVFGVIALLMFSSITMYASMILADSYRFPDPVTGTRNYTYSQAVQKYLGGSSTILSAIAQYVNLFGYTVGYTLTASLSIVAIHKSQCFHKNGQNAGCDVSMVPATLTFGAIQMLLSQIPNISGLSWLSVLTTLMCFIHTFIGLGLSIAKVAGGGNAPTNLTGVPTGENYSIEDKVWNCFTAFGNLAFAYGFSEVLIEIQDTLRSRPPENRIMKQTSIVGISISTLVYLACGLLGYAAFGNNAPGNWLAGFGFFEPFWLIDLANICVIIHLCGAYQISAQPIFGFIENTTRTRWPDFKLNVDFKLGGLHFNIFRLVWRTSYVVATTLLAIMFPFFNDIVGLLGAVAFWPLTVYFPFKMHIRREKLQRFSVKWIFIQVLNLTCLFACIAAIVGSVGGIIKSMQTYKIFHGMT